MNNLRIEEALRKRGMSKMQVALKAKISPADLYQAFNGKKPFFPAWRKRVASALEMPQKELFPEDE